ncbi:hypothetical protein Scep_018305 [Stephania cephalantha]|uniref:ClpA/ClpB AAA lid domain-containing protein n=1 Tax=Stephania cephalantha TaxID=152367 RepID=A0AAP0IT40_9MAGN
MEKLEEQSRNRHMEMLDKYGTNLTNLAKEKKLDPVIGRQEQIEHVMRILCKRRKNNPCLIGEPGVGKTAIAEGISSRIVTNNVPQNSVIKRLISKHLTLSEQGKLIGATTVSEYKKHIEKDSALERRFQPILVPEPSVDEAILIIQSLRQPYEEHHNVRYEDNAAVAAVRLSDRYIRDRFLPDKAIDLIDEAGSHARINASSANEDVVVKEIDVQHVISSWTGIPIRKLST